MQQQPRCDNSHSMLHLQERLLLLEGTQRKLCNLAKRYSHVRNVHMLYKAVIKEAEKHICADTSEDVGCKGMLL